MPGHERTYTQCPCCASLLAVANDDDIREGSYKELPDGVAVRPISGPGVDDYIKSRSDIRYVHPPVNPFDYVKPSEDALAAMTAVNDRVKDTYTSLLNEVPDCSERQLAIRKLQEFRMWANCAIVMEQSRYGEYEFVETEVEDGQ